MCVGGGPVRTRQDKLREFVFLLFTPPPPFPPRRISAPLTWLCTNACLASCSQQKKHHKKEKQPRHRDAGGEEDRERLVKEAKRFLKQSEWWVRLLEQREWGASTSRARSAVAEAEWEGQLMKPNERGFAGAEW